MGFPRGPSPLVGHGEGPTRLETDGLVYGFPGADSVERVARPQNMGCAQRSPDGLRGSPHWAGDQPIGGIL